MYSDGDTPKGWVAPFGHPGIKACSQLPRAFRSVPRPSSPPGAKASTRCPSHAQTLASTPQGASKPTMHRNHPRPQLTGRDAPPIPRQANTHHLLSTHIHAPEHCSRTSTQSPRHPLAETTTCPGSDTHAGTATDTPTQLPTRHATSTRQTKATRDALRVQRRTRT